MLYFYIACILISETAAISLLKKFLLTSQWYYFALGAVCFVLVAFFLTKSFKYEDIGIVNALWAALSVIVVVLTGYFYFKEQVSLVEMLGMGLIIVGVFLLRHKIAG